MPKKSVRNVRPRKATKRENLIFQAAQLCARQHETIVFSLNGGVSGTGITVANALMKEFGLPGTFEPPPEKKRRKKLSMTV